ncbi:unnamed protein product [Didymodactylos carnosus]|uniref:GH16 domain-containing protein n=1 Tax=Didymodactylos carnosus TaxID=1234261 RepID=A0A816BKA9_9BILA|nr:unnamed protein product [Didymodactylos carnosus]CAF1610312.1 unnamed protein product [Didymodactylos carnosus]CAF3814401.1 unnamed protein product [Didymodactylos carnosus]CAF4493007.1 unnamed protein product [Didymodactylos carnosus]
MIKLYSFILVATIIALKAGVFGQKSINWSGYTWYLKDAISQGPGPNRWSSDNVWLDSQNNLHLKIVYSNGIWSCAELYTTEKFGFGTYQWFVEGQIDKFDPNIVLGFFTYGGTDQENEIDIEMAKWGQTSSQAYNLFYTVYPKKVGLPTNSSGTKISLSGTYTTHRFAWSSKQVAWESLHGFTDSNTNQFFQYTTPSNYQQYMPVANVPLHINLWLFQGKQPMDGKEVEIVVHSFKYTKV